MAEGGCLGQRDGAFVLSALNAHTAGSVEPSQPSRFKALQASFVKIVPGLCWKDRTTAAACLPLPHPDFWTWATCDRAKYR